MAPQQAALADQSQGHTLESNAQQALLTTSGAEWKWTVNFTVTPNWIAREAAHSWLNHNPRGSYFPQPLIVKLPGGLEGWVRSSAFGNETSVTLELPIEIASDPEKAREVIDLAVRRALSVKQWVEDGRHLMNGAEA